MPCKKHYTQDGRPYEMQRKKGGGVGRHYLGLPRKKGRKKR